MKISILGCGWLGFPLAKKLLEDGFSVNGSTTSIEKISVLEKEGINSFLISVSEDGIDGNMHLFLENSDVLIIDIPPKLRSSNSENFVQKIKNLMPFIEKSSVEKVLFISSTSVYSDDLSLSEITENTTPQPDSESGKQLLETENILQSNPNFKTTIVRFGGLFGEDRNPIKYLAGRKNVENPDAPINLIHQKDCIGIIEKIIETQNWNEIFNAVAPFHPTRKEHYTEKAVEQNLEIPEFDYSKASVGKSIDSSKTARILKYNFQIKP